MIEYNKPTVPLEISYFMEKITAVYGHEMAKQILFGMQKKRVVSLRINTLKTHREYIEHVLTESGINYQDVAWSNDALIIHADEKDIEKLSIYQNGKIYLQSLSSMIPALILEPRMGADILDMASAPGGKTTQIAMLTENKAHLTATEAHPIRAEKLKFNIERQGAKNITVLIKDARLLDEFFRFDQILLDAPCSGSGTFCLDQPKTYLYFSKKLIEKSIETQSQLLKKAIQLLKPGQTLVYSTCSILPEENEHQILNVLKKEKVDLIPIEDYRFEHIPKLKSQLEGTLLIQPTAEYEGFFVAKLQKRVK